MEFPNYPISAMKLDPDQLLSDDPLNTADYEFKFDENGLQIKEEPSDYESNITEDYMPPQSEFLELAYANTDDHDYDDSNYNNDDNEDDDDNKSNIVKIKTEFKVEKKSKVKKALSLPTPTTELIKLKEFTKFIDDPLDSYHRLKKKKFKCDKCGVRITKIENYNQHLLEHNEITPYECDVCKKCFKTPTYLSNHQKLHLRESNKCKICDKLCYTERDFNIHMEQHKSNIVPYKCGYCFIMYSDADQLLTHMNKHCGTRMHCDLCEKRFFDISSLDLHIKIHAGLKPFKCSECDKSFKYESLLNFHKIVHMSVRRYKCDFCEKTFKVEAQIRAHMRLNHRPTKNYRCNDCGEVSQTLKLSQNHRKQHRLKEEKPYKCGICLEKFSILNEFIVHMKSHENPTYQCNGCDKYFKKIKLLKVHVRNQMGDKPYKCNLCPRTFSLLNQLGYHMSKEHNEEKPYVCNLCNKTYCAYATYKNHMDRHTGKWKKHKCEICGKRLAHIKSHMQNIHKIQPEKGSK